jgi:hypothetical protein
METIAADWIWIPIVTRGGRLPEIPKRESPRKRTVLEAALTGMLMIIAEAVDTGPMAASLKIACPPEQLISIAFSMMIAPVKTAPRHMIVSFAADTSSA